MPNKNSPSHSLVYNRYNASILFLHCSNTLIVSAERLGERNKGIETEGKTEGKRQREKLKGQRQRGKRQRRAT
jgi:hypothetical protein